MALQGESPLGQPPGPPLPRADPTGVVQQAMLFLLGGEAGKPGAHLNKHAEEVERARRILLDDHEIESRCLREMLATRVGEQEDGKLPLGIVHWQHNVTAKFNIGKRTGPFVTTVELLYSILTDLFDLKRP